MGLIVLIAIMVIWFYVTIVMVSAFDLAREMWRARKPWTIWRPETGEDIRDHAGNPLRFRTRWGAYAYTGRTMGTDIEPVLAFRVRVRRVTGV